MTDDELRLMELHGITCETKTVFFYDGYRYDRLQDAVSFAKQNRVVRRIPTNEAPEG